MENLDTLSRSLRAFGEPPNARRQRCSRCSLFTKFFHLHLLAPLCSICVLEPKYRLAPKEIAKEFYRLSDEEISNLPYVVVWSGRAIGDGAGVMTLYLRSDLENKATSKYNNSYREFLEAMVAREKKNNIILSTINLSMCDDLKGPARPDVALCRPYGYDKHNPSYNGLLHCKGRIIPAGPPQLCEQYVANNVLTVVVGSSRVPRRNLWYKSVLKDEDAEKQNCGVCDRPKGKDEFPYWSWCRRSTRAIRCKACLARENRWPCDWCERELLCQNFDPRHWRHKTAPRRYIFCYECKSKAEVENTTPLKLMNARKEKGETKRARRQSSRGPASGLLSSTTSKAGEAARDDEDEDLDVVRMNNVVDDDDARSDTTQPWDKEEYYQEDLYRSEEAESAILRVRGNHESNFEEDDEIFKEEEEEEEDMLE